MATAPVVGLATWALFGIQEIGLLIEDPFQVRAPLFGFIHLSVLFRILNEGVFTSLLSSMVDSRN